MKAFLTTMGYSISLHSYLIYSEFYVFVVIAWLIIQLELFQVCIQLDDLLAKTT